MGVGISTCAFARAVNDAHKARAAKTAAIRAAISILSANSLGLLSHLLKRRYAIIAPFRRIFILASSVGRHSAPLTVPCYCADQREGILGRHGPDVRWANGRACAPKAKRKFGAVCCWRFLLSRFCKT